MKRIAFIITLALLLASCVQREYRIVHVEAIGNPVADYYVIYTVNDHQVEAILDYDQLTMLQEAANDNLP